MRFCLVVPDEFKRHYEAHSFEISGLLQWAKVFDGDVRTINEDLTAYTHIMTNVSSTESEYISLIRQEVPDATVIACLDYGFSVINQYFLPGFEKRIGVVMSRADHVFSVNRNQVEWMKLVVPDKPIHYIPHPSDTERIVKFRRPNEQKTQGVAVMWHQYDNYQAQPLLILKAVEKHLKKRIQKTLIGLPRGKMLELGMATLTAGIPVISDEHPDPTMRGKPIDPDMTKIAGRAPLGTAWDAVMPYLGVEDWYGILSGYTAALDLYTVNSIGRFGIDCAGVGTPLVASDKQDSSKLLWPFTTVDPFEPTRAIQHMAKLLSNTEYYAHAQKTADKNLWHYGFVASKERMMRILKE